MDKLYAVMKVISVLVRQFCLPNPFECFGAGAIIINLVAEPLIHLAAYLLVGLVYNKGDCPALGSFLYLVAYALITGVLALLGVFSFAWWWILTVAVAMIVIWMLLAKLWRWLNGETRKPC